MKAVDRGRYSGQAVEMERLPPLKSLEAFVAVGQSLSMQRAAALLHRTPSAISYRIRDLETHLGVRLFERLNRALRLTPEGQSYLRTITGAFQRIEEASTNLMSGGLSDELTVFVVQPLAVKWILPKLSRFYVDHPDIRLSFQPRTSREYPATFPEDLKDGVQIRFGQGTWSGFHCELIAKVRSFPVCSPALLKKLQTPKDLVRHVWINANLYPQAWPDWLATAGLSQLRPRQFMQIDDTELKYETAVHGLGVAIGVDLLVRPYLEAGTLVAPFGIAHEMSESYYLVCHPDAVKNPNIRAFTDWLRDLGEKHSRASPWPAAQKRLQGRHKSRRSVHRK